MVCKNLCLVPFSCLNVSNSSSNAAMRRLALASEGVGTAPLGPGIASVETRTSFKVNSVVDIAEVSDVEVK
jgi:hypothetical protein